MIDMNRVETVLRKNVWEVELSSLPRWKALLTKVLRVFYVVIRDVIEWCHCLQSASLF